MLSSLRQPSLAALRSRRHCSEIMHRSLRPPTPATAATPLARRAQAGDNDQQPPLACLSSLLARADDPSSPETEVDAAEEAATELALELSTTTREEQKQQRLRGFGRAALPPRRAYSLADLRLSRVEPSRVLSPVDATLDSFRDKAQIAAAAGAVALAAAAHPSFSQGVSAAASLFFLATLDAVVANGGFGFLVLDSAARVFSSSYAKRVAAHEAGHFLVAYLLGLLPRGYDLSSLSAFKRSRALNVQAGTRLCDVAFRKEVSSGKISSSSVDRAAAVALAGVAAEYCLFRRDGKNDAASNSDEIGESAEGGLGDIQQLDALLKALAFSQTKADSTVRYALLTAVTLLRRHSRAHSRLAEAMLRGEGVVECVAAVEAELAAVADDDI
jgi:hypothetical protein